MVQLFEGARLASWGIGALLLQICMMRGWNAFRWHMAETRAWPKPRYHYASPRRGASPTQSIAATMVALIPLLAFTQPLLNRYISWLNIGPTPALSVMSVWALIVLQMISLYMIAFRPRFKMCWGAAWIVFAHIVSVLQ